MATKAEVTARSAEMLQRKRLGQAMDSSLQTRLDTAYTEIYADLKDDQLVTWSETGVIPDKIVPHLSALMAFNATDSIHVSQVVYQRIVSARNIAKREIRRLVTPKYEQLDDAEDF